MGQQKLIRFGELENFANVLQYPENMTGMWHTHFHNNNPLVLELACGKGEYSVGLGRENKDTNYIGVDVKGNRMYVGAKKALAEGLTNIAFLRTQIDQITNYFAKDEVDGIWIIFPDPFLRESKARHRLTHAKFLRMYQQILKPGSVIHLKTDSKELYDFTLESITEAGCAIRENIVDIYGQGKATGALAIRTFYEEMHLANGRTIYYISFTLPAHDVVIPPKKRKDESAAE